jgi:AmmeMemoRadiSam system protein B/AmmeMemoRadiSam system protein A
MKSKAVCFIFLILFLPAAQCSSDFKKKVERTDNFSQIMEKDTVINRKPAVAGTFYPSNPSELNDDLERMFSAGTPDRKLMNIVALISPHAGYVYSGIVAASAYNQLSPEKIYDNVFIIGTSHQVSFDGASIYTEGNFLTPLGVVKVNITLANQLINKNPGIFLAKPEAHKSEHSLEVQIPFLQHIYKDNLQIIPIIIASQNPRTIEKIAEALAPYFNNNNLFVISTDFSHYPSYKDALLIDKITAEAIIENSPETFMNVLEANDNRQINNLATSICGWSSVLALLYITDGLTGVSYQDLKYMNSGDVKFGDKNRVVGYHAMAVTMDENNFIKKAETGFDLTEKEREKLLRIARVTMEGYLDSGEIPVVNKSELTGKLLEPLGAFVTLTKEGKLRGCIGQFHAEGPLYKVVQDMAVAAAVRDYRFAKVTKEELDNLEIEISVLTPMQKIKSINEIELGKHGIYIVKGNSGGTFLPQVAKQTGWNLEEFLGHCARDKANIGWDGWKDADIYIYEAYVFAEHK